MHLTWLLHFRKAKDALRSGEVIVRVTAQFANDLVESRHFVVAKPFFKPYMMIFCETSPVTDLNRDVFLVHDDDENGSWVWSFCTSLDLCSQLLDKHGQSCSAVHLAVVESKGQSLNTLRLARNAEDCTVYPVCIFLRLESRVQSLELGILSLFLLPRPVL